MARLVNGKARLFEKLAAVVIRDELGEDERPVGVQGRKVHFGDVVEHAVAVGRGLPGADELHDLALVVEEEAGVVFIVASCRAGEEAPEGDLPGVVEDRPVAGSGESAAGSRITLVISPLPSGAATGVRTRTSVVWAYTRVGRRRRAVVRRARVRRKMVMAPEV